MTKNDEISDETLLQDIANMIKEYNAYINLAEGYESLSSAYKDTAERCKTFLDFLNHLKETRGL